MTSTRRSARVRALRVLAGAAALACLSAIVPEQIVRAQPQSNALVPPALLQELRFRQVGPFRGGRVTAVAGHRRQPSTFYMGATGGGVWKTVDNGQTWLNVSDGYFATASIGAIEVAESDPNVIYVGTGSAAIRSNVILGKGVYKSTDAGKTWTFVGLEKAGQIGAIKIHPRNPDIAYAAALGRPFGANAERGVFRTSDGGRSWKKVLFINDRTGVVSLAMNPAAPDELYAGAWRAERRPWTIVSGGPAREGGVYKTTDGGATWRHLEKGLPSDLIGKVGVDVSPSNPSRVWVILEAPGTQAGVYRSDDSGASFQQVSSQPSLIARPFYYTYIDADPKNQDTVYVNNLAFWKSTDGGKSWQAIPTPHGDNHGMWINPDNPDVFIQSNDGGANVTLNGGRSWSTQYNQPTAEIYQVAVDDQFPYRLYGAQQDNSTVIVPSLPPAALGVDQPSQYWTEGPGCETGPIMPKVGDPTIVYGSCKGEFSRMNMKVGQEQQYWVHPQNRYGHAASDVLYRFQRVSPMELSPHDPKVIYYGSQFVHRTTDEGVTWETISPDLTAREAGKQGVSGEPITRDVTGEEVYSTLYALRESPIEKGVLWAGANDGPVHVSRDAGRTWTNVTPAGLPPGGRVQNIDVSRHRPGSAYVAVYRYLLDDWQPYIYRTDDHGATWTRLTTGSNGIPSDYPTRVVREDPDREGLLYAGTEFGLFISFDNGAHWQPFQQNLPVTPVTDIRLHRRDLVVSTMGRGFWILDDVMPLQQVATVFARSRGQTESGGWKSGLLDLRDAWRTRYRPSGGRPDEPDYPPPGARIDYFLASETPGGITIEILDAGGRLVRTYSSAGISVTALAERPETAGEGDEARRPSAAVRLATSPGLHRFTWDLRFGTGDGLRRGTGPMAVPGKYFVRLKAGDVVETKVLELHLDPRVVADGVTQADLEEQLRFLLRVQASMSGARKTAAEIAAAIARIAARGDRIDEANPLRALRARLVTASGPYPQPMLIDQLASIERMAGGADQKVGRIAFTYLEALEKELAAIQSELTLVSRSDGVSRN